MQKTYSYAASVKSGVSDELINTYLIRPLAGIAVRLIYSTPLTPNHVTIASIFVGLVAAYFYLEGTALHNLVAGFCITVKDVLDSADGQLARARQQYSRVGRFLDSIGDIIVNALVFCAITVALIYGSGSAALAFLGVLAFVGTTLRVSYHVFYHTSFLHLSNSYEANRVTEDITCEDAQETPMTLRLQRVFLFLYGWQDRLMVEIDRWCYGKGEPDSRFFKRWYSDRIGLRLSGLLGLGTELFLLMLLSVTNHLQEYLLANIFGMNCIWGISVLYRKRFLAQQVKDAQHPDRLSGGP
ncbi:MAG: CDP-alcohol phosphatidyltransferase family protein [Bacteroidetes bacterium]|nr:CDP-alcohol phosphatidyltransferase family protein [Bacteroidota bacterium]MCW5896889.1 CDP-alcohol phosphatidyltransferase family protein [Bacteroidota bacterium]